MKSFTFTKMTIENTVDTVDYPYKWRQTLQDVDVSLLLPNGTKARDLQIQFKPLFISVKVKSTGSVLLEGELCKSIKLEDSTWTVEQGTLDIHLYFFLFSSQFTHLLVNLEKK